MKRIFTFAILALSLAAVSAGAQTLRKTWDFRNGFSQKTVNALKGDQEEFGDNKYWRNYESDATKADEQHFWNASTAAKNADGYACTHNGGQEKVISELEGLKLGFTAAKKFVVTYNGSQAANEFESDGGPALGEPIPHGKSYIWLNGKSETISFQAEVGQTIKIGVESHAVNRTKLGEARGISLSTSAGSLTLTQGNAVPTYYTECEWELTGDAGTVATLTIKSTNGCHIYYIIVGEGDDPNANKTQVGYVTDGDATTEAAYQTLAADETFSVTAIDAASLTSADQLAAYGATVISPALPADNAAVATLKQAIAFYPIVNLNAALYAAWGYGEAVVSDMPMALIQDMKHEVVSGFVENEDFEYSDDMAIVTLGDESFTGVRLGSFFEGDEMPVVDGNDQTVAAVHVHNPYHNAYIYLPFGTTPGAMKLLTNAIDMVKSSKSEITQAPAPKIGLEYKNHNTNITLSMASSTLPRPHIYYTLDGSAPTEQSQEYTDVINVTNRCTVKAVAVAEGYLLSEVATAEAEIFDQPDMPAVNCEFEDGKTIVSLECATPDVELWYSFKQAEAADTTQSMKYTGPLTIALPTDFTAFSVAGRQVFSELAQKRVVVKNARVRQDQIGLFDANAADWQNGGGSTVYYFSWGKTATSIYDNTQEGTTTEDPETGDEITTYPERDYEYYVPVDEEGNVKSEWEVKSKGQVMIWQSLSVGNDPGNGEGYNPETTGDVLSYAKTTNNDVQFGGKTSGERCTGAIQSLKKFQGPFDVVTIVGTAAGGDNVGRMQVEVSKDSVEWTKLGDEMATSTVKRLWKSYTRSYDEADEVYVRLIQAGGGASVQIYNIYILNEGENSQALKQQYDEEFAASGEGLGISDISAAKAATGIYNLSGVRLGQMQRGLNIVVSDGKARKVMK